MGTLEEFPNSIKAILLLYMEDGGVDRIVIDCRQNQFGQMADFSPLLTFLSLTYKNLMYHKLNLRSWGTQMNLVNTNLFENYVDS